MLQDTGCSHTSGNNAITLLLSERHNPGYDAGIEHNRQTDQESQGHAMLEYETEHGGFLPVCRVAAVATTRLWAEIILEAPGFDPCLGDCGPGNNLVAKCSNFVTV